MRRPRFPLVLCSILLLPALTLCQEAYRVSPGDVLDIQVFRHADRSGSYVVRHDGRITHPATGEIDVRGKTIQELTDIFTEALSRELRDPNVVINVSSREPHFIYVLGEVTRAGPQNVEMEGVTVKEAIAQAGGLPDTADPIAELHRGGSAPVEIDLEREMEVGPDEATRLYEDDILLVEPLLQGYVGVVGTAGAPRRVPFEKDDDLLDVLAKGGGAGEGVDLQNAIILRADGEREVIDLEAIQEGRWEGDLPQIGPDDFLILPELPPQEYVTVLGRVGAQKLAIDREKGLSLSDVLAATTPFAEDADASHARIIHADGSITELDLKALIDGTADESLLDLQMQPDDLVMIPKQFAEVAALGEVPRPGIFTLEPGDRVLDLLKAAGGVQARRGQKRFALLVRRPDGAAEPEVRQLDLNGILAGRAEEQNIELQPEDILYVPGPKKKWYEKARERLTPFYLLREFSLLFTDPLGRDYGRYR